MSIRSEAVLRHRRKRRNEIIYFMGGKCALCGYDKDPSALEMHHLNPLEKQYQLSSGNCKRIQDDIEEAKKCILLCANCHRETHSGMHKDLITSFNQDKALEVLKTYQIAAPKQCPKCGKVIAKTSQYCQQCFKQIKNEQFSQNHPNREKLKQLIRTTPFTTIGTIYCCSDNAVRKWCDKYNLPRTKTEINKYSDEEWEKI